VEGLAIVHRILRGLGEDSFDGIGSFAFFPFSYPPPHSLNNKVTNGLFPFSLKLNISEIGYEGQVQKKFLTRDYSSTVAYIFCMALTMFAYS
jgi:hypothetical protein